MITINRTAVVVKPNRIFLAWLHAKDPTSRSLTLDELRKEATIYLLPECRDEAAVRRMMGELCGQIFEEQLAGWHDEPSSWPKRRGLQTFEQWFDWSIHWMVADLSNKPLRRDKHEP